jgi:nickel/cobalt transporter (NicO) family protein
MPPMTRPEPMRVRRASRRAWVAAAAAAVSLALVVPALALAHPLGNFTINHYAGIRVEPDRVILDVVIDQAEIPTFQEKLRIDTDSDGMVSDEEAEAERVAACPRLAPELTLTAGGRALPLVAVAAGLSFPPGAAGLETMRLVCTYTAALPAPLAVDTAIAFSDRSHIERIGWHEVTLTGSGVTVADDLPAASVSERLTVYPTSLLSQPLDMRSVAFMASPGGPTLAPWRVPEAQPLAGAPTLYPAAEGAVEAPVRAGGPTVGSAAEASAAPVGSAAPVAAAAVPGGVGADISGLLETSDLTPLVLLGSIVAAMALGAGHALTPGHGKTLMGAYLVGTRGTAVHAVALGLSVTVSHTLGVLVLAAIVILFRGVLPAETFNRVAPAVSGILVLGIGAWLLLGQLRSRRGVAGTPGHDHRHGHDDAYEDGAYEHDHAHAHEPTGTASPRLDLDGTHSRGGIRHSHPRPTGTTMTWRSLFVLGLAGGVIPSTNALIILLATIATGRAAYGLVLVVAFGLGMAVVLGGVGLGLVLARDRIENLPARSSLGRVAAYAPLAAGVVVFSLGVYLTTQAVGVVPTL